MEHWTLYTAVFSCTAAPAFLAQPRLDSELRTGPLLQIVPLIRYAGPMTSATELTRALRSLPPRLHAGAHKGQMGKVGIVGGCAYYTGAPYFAAMASLRLGADLVTVACTPEAAVPLKSYSPELMVYDCLPGQYTKQDGDFGFMEQLVQKVDCLVIGPGLGRDASVLRFVERIIKEAISQHCRMVIDGDGLFLLTQRPTLLQNYKHVVLTPNAMEFRRLWNALTDQGPPSFDIEAKDRVKMGLITDTATRTHADTLSQLLGGATIIRKGTSDIISNGEIAIQCSDSDCLRRCGGQGDLLAGFVGTCMAWASRQSEACVEPECIAAVAGSLLTRACTSITFKSKQRHMVITDCFKAIPEAFDSIFTE